MPGPGIHARSRASSVRQCLPHHVVLPSVLQVPPVPFCCCCCCCADHTCLGSSGSADGLPSCPAATSTEDNNSCAPGHDGVDAEGMAVYKATCPSACQSSPTASESDSTASSSPIGAPTSAVWPPAPSLSLTRASDRLASQSSAAPAAQPLPLHGKLVSVTLVTRPAEILIGAALQSVAPAVDACLLLYSSIIASPELTLRAAAQAVGDKLIVQELPAGPLDAMLDSSLDWARQLGASWALLIGADQQLVGPGASRVAGEVARAAAAGVSQVNCLNTHLDYAQVRVLRNALMSTTSRGPSSKLLSSTASAALR